MNGWQQILLEWAYSLCAPSTAHAWEIFDTIANIYLGEGRVEEALKIGDQLDDPNCYYLGKLASSLARIGRRDLSHRIIASIEASLPTAASRWMKCFRPSTVNWD